MTISTQDILNVLQPQCCAYTTGDAPGLIEVPQNDMELQTVRENISEHAVKMISYEETKRLGYETLASWSNENDYLLITEDEYFLLCLPKSLFQTVA